MNNEAIIAVAGIIGTLLGSILTMLLNHHMKEKSEQKKKRSEIITKAKKIGMDLSRAVINLSFYYEDYSKLPNGVRIERRTDKDGMVLLKGPICFHQRLIGEISELCAQLVELSGHSLTYKETKNLYNNIREDVGDVTNFTILIDKKFRDQKFDKTDVEEVKSKMDNLLKNISKLHILEI